LKDSGESASESQDKEQQDNPAPPPPPPPPILDMNLMDEPLPDNINLVKPTSPQGKLKHSSPPTDKKEGDSIKTPSPKLSMELGRISKSFPEPDLGTTSSSATISMENETRSTDSPKKTSGVSTPSRLSCKSGELPPEKRDSPTPQYKLLERQPTMEMDSQVILNAGNLRVDTPFVPVEFVDDNVPLITSEPRGSSSSSTSSVSVIPTITTVVAPAPPASSSAAAEASSQGAASSSLAPSSANMTLPIIGQRIDDVKTIKRPKPGGSWF